MPIVARPSGANGRFDLDLGRTSGVFHCIVQKIAKDDVQVDPSPARRRLQLAADAVGRHAIAEAGRPGIFQ